MVNYRGSIFRNLVTGETVVTGDTSATFVNIAGRNAQQPSGYILSEMGEGYTGAGTIGATGLAEGPTWTIAERRNKKAQIPKVIQQFREAEVPQLIDPSGMMGLQRYFETSPETTKAGAAKVALSSLAAGGVAYYLTTNPTYAVGAAVLGYLLGKKVL